MFLSLSLFWKVCGTSHLPTYYSQQCPRVICICHRNFSWSLSLSLTYIHLETLSLPLSLSFTHNLPIYSNSFSNLQTDSQTDQYLRLFETEQPNFVRSKNWTILPLPKFTSKSLSLTLSLSLWLKDNFLLPLLLIFNKKFTLKDTHTRSHSSFSSSTTLSLFHRWTNRGQPQRQKHLSRQIKVSHWQSFYLPTNNMGCCCSSSSWPLDKYPSCFTTGTTYYNSAVDVVCTNMVQWHQWALQLFKKGWSYKQNSNISAIANG